MLMKIRLVALLRDGGTFRCVGCGACPRPSLHGSVVTGGGKPRTLLDTCGYLWYACSTCGERQGARSFPFFTRAWEYICVAESRRRMHTLRERSIPITYLLYRVLCRRSSRCPAP